MELKLEPGLKSRVDMTVEYKDTAKAVASGLAEVFATPAMIALMENAAYTAVQPHLPAGLSTVGTRVDAKHLAATPMGFKVWAEAVLTEVDGRRLTFDIAAYDETEKIGEARHERFVIDEQKLLSRTEAKGKR
jgi:predicted thioesterase